MVIYCSPIYCLCGCALQRSNIPCANFLSSRPNIYMYIYIVAHPIHSGNKCMH